MPMNNIKGGLDFNQLFFINAIKINQETLPLAGQTNGLRWYNDNIISCMIWLIRNYSGCHFKEDEKNMDQYIQILAFLFTY